MKKCPFCAEEIQDEAIVCKHCGRDIGNLPQPVIQPPKAGSTPNYALILLVLIGLGLTTFLYIQNEKDKVTDQINQAIMGSIDESIDENLIVRYRISGQPEQAIVSYLNPQGGTEQISEADLPWQKSFDLPSGSLVSLSAQSLGSGNIFCQILINDREFKRSKSSGDFAVVTCSGIIP